MIYTKYYSSPLGRIRLSSDGENLTGAWFEGQKYFPYDLSTKEMSLPVFEKTSEWFDIYFSGKEPKFCPQIKLIGTNFQKSVWEILLEIPYGETVSYGDIAKKLGISAFQAVGGAVGRNNISVIVPCHRVIGKNKSLTGYAGGLYRKEKLLALEKSIKK